MVGVPRFERGIPAPKAEALVVFGVVGAPSGSIPRFGKGAPLRDAVPSEKSVPTRPGTATG